VGDLVSLPLEHWEALGELAAEMRLVKPETWQEMSRVESGQGPELRKLKGFYDGLLNLQAFLRTDMTRMLRKTARFPEPLPGWEHARMLEAVIRVIQLRGPEYTAWVE
jgi:hypothetical protein